MRPDVFHAMTSTVALAYMMQSTPSTANIFGRVHGRAMADINLARQEREQLAKQIQRR